MDDKVKHVLFVVLDFLLNLGSEQALHLGTSNHTAAKTATPITPRIKKPAGKPSVFPNADRRSLTAPGLVAG